MTTAVLTNVPRSQVLVTAANIADALISSGYSTVRVSVSGEAAQEYHQTDAQGRRVEGPAAEVHILLEAP